MNTWEGGGWKVNVDGQEGGDRAGRSGKERERVWLDRW